MDFVPLLSEVLSELKSGTHPEGRFTSPQIVCNAKCPSSLLKGSPTRTIVLDVKTCQIHLIFKCASGSFDRKILFLTPQPATFPSSLLVSPCGSFLAILTETSVHILDLAKLEPILQSQQNKIVAKLVTIYNSLTDSPDALRLLVRARWHPTARGVLFLLTRDGFLHLLHCDWNASGSLSVKTELQVSVLRTLEAGHKLSTDKESIHNNQRKGQMKLNLNFALGAVCSDFDIGSPLFTADVQSLSGLLSSPVYVLCENGDILMVSPSSNSRSEALVRVVRIIPSAEDCYTFDFDSILCMSSTGAENSPDVLCIASRSGRIFHGIILHVPAAVLLESDSISHGRSVPILYLIDGVDLQLTKPLSSQRSRKDAPASPPSDSVSSDGPPQLSKIYLLPTASTARDAHMAHYLCVHQSGIHCILLPWIARLSQLCSRTSEDTSFSPADLAPLPGDHGCSAEHLLLTHLGSEDLEETALPGFSRSVIGIIPPQTPISDTSANRSGALGGSEKVEEAEDNSLLVLFSSRPHFVKIVLPPSLSFNSRPHSVPQQSLPGGDSPDVSVPETPLVTSVSLSSRATESDFFRSCRRVLSNYSIRLPVLSTDLKEDVFSEAEFIRFFVKTISCLRSSRLGRLSSLCASVYQFAEHAEGQLAAQYEAVSYLAQERDQLQRKAVSLTERHSRILERQEALNHRLSELTRRIYSIEAGLTSAEAQMRLEVQSLRDRLKSGLLGWYESMQLQYNHLTVLVEKAQTSGASGRFGRLTGNVGVAFPAAPASPRRSAVSDDLTQVQLKNITAALKEEGSEIDSLIKAVERLNTLTVDLR